MSVDHEDFDGSLAPKDFFKALFMFPGAYFMVVVFYGLVTWYADDWTPPLWWFIVSSVIVGLLVWGLVSLRVFQAGRRDWAAGLISDEALGRLKDIWIELPLVSSVGLGAIGLVALIIYASHSGM